MEYLDKLKNLFGKKEEPAEIKTDESPLQEEVLNKLALQGKLEGPAIGETLYDQHQIGEFIRFLRKFKQEKQKVPGTEDINSYYKNKGNK